MLSSTTHPRAQAWGSCRLPRALAASRGVRCHAWRRVSFPAEHKERIQEPAAHEMMEKARLVELQVETLGTARTALVGPETTDPDRPAFILLHGFDSSMLEFRRFQPLLSRLGDVYAVDLAGWGFTDIGADANPNLVLGPQQKREHLHAIWREVVGSRPAVIVGTSLGGTIALDFALHYPHAVDRLVLVDPQGFIDGLGLLPKLPRFVLELALKVLQADWLRESANQMAYFNKQRYATEDARRIGKLHTFLPGWVNANISFMRSNGYSISQRIPHVTVPSLVIWGRNDEILDPANAEKFLEALPDARLKWIEQCGHCAHLEQPQALFDAIADFVSDWESSSGGSGSEGEGEGLKEGAAGAGLQPTVL